ncbi:hypothetical protein QQ045_031310 [Rhodiola kirilowii]
MLMDPYSNGIQGSDEGVEFHKIDGFDGSETQHAEFTNWNFMDDNISVSPLRGGVGIGDSMLPFFGSHPQGDFTCSNEGGDSSDPVFKYISQMLMEEDMGEKPWMLHDSLALTVAEKSLYDALGERYPDTVSRSSVLVDSPDGSNSHSYGFSENSSSGSSNANETSYGLQARYPGDVGLYQHSSLFSNPLPASDVRQPLSFSSSNDISLNGFHKSAEGIMSGNSSLNGLGNDVNGLVGSNSSLSRFDLNVNGLGNVSMNSFQASELFNDSEYILQFQRGVEEASKFLPKTSNLTTGLENYQPVVQESTEVAHAASASRIYKEEKNSFVNELPAARLEKKENKSGNGVREATVVKIGNENLVNGLRGRKRADVDLEDERINKQSAVYVDEDELSEMFDNVLLHCRIKEESQDCDIDLCERSPSEKNKNVNGGNHGSSKESSRDKKQDGGSEPDTVDLRMLLVLCAQAVSSDDRRNANELLKQIRQHSSPLGDGSQRLAHCFANGLEARMAGTGNQIYTALSSKRTTAADILKAYQVYLHNIPFKQIVMSFANQMIYLTSSKAQTLHIVDFGILYGFQWPILIQCLSRREGGPPKLRITGIDLPQPGFRPAERVEETGRRLEKYCKRFGVPFEYYAIAQKWDTIKIEDLKIKRNEFLAVNCLFRFKNLLDETVEVNSPRNAVLNLIREMSPNIFTHGIVNGSYNSPFFVTRFREALFYYSALFDVFDVTIPLDNQQRLMFERELYGKDAINVIACEGIERVERPESYKQWQIRCMRAGFKQLPLDKEVMTKLRNKMEAWYHKDFVIDDDGRWLLLGWKGRIVFGATCWIPA